MTSTISWCLYSIQSSRNWRKTRNHLSTQGKRSTLPMNWRLLWNLIWRWTWLDMRTTTWVPFSFLLVLRRQTIQTTPGSTANERETWPVLSYCRYLAMIEARSIDVLSRSLTRTSFCVTEISKRVYLREKFLISTPVGDSTSAAWAEVLFTWFWGVPVALFLSWLLYGYECTLTNSLPLYVYVPTVDAWLRREQRTDFFIEIRWIVCSGHSYTFGSDMRRCDADCGLKRSYLICDEYFIFHLLCRCCTWNCTFILFRSYSGPVIALQTYQIRCMASLLRW